MATFLLKNPLASGLGILLALALVACSVQTVRLSWSQADVAKAERAFADFKEDLAAKSLKVMQDAAAKSEQQYNALATAIGAIGQLGTQTKTEIRYVQSNGGPCVADPAWRTTVGGVQRILDGGGASSGQGEAGSRASAAMPGTTTAGSK
jgi:hypothetical protein